MYFLNFNEIDEKTQKQFVKLLQKYYRGEIYNDETLQKYVENERNKENAMHDEVEQKRL